MNPRFLPGIISIIFIALVFFPGPGAWLTRALRLSDRAELRDVDRLEARNQALLAELAVLRDVKDALSRPRANLVPALVYSRYPLNFRNELLLDAGEEQGVKAGDGVFAVSDDAQRSLVLIGRVIKLWPSRTLVQTIYDPGYQLAVRAGDKGVEALLVGGNQPKLTLIPRTSVLESGAVVYSASSDLPYGVAVGKVERVSIGSDTVFTEATLSFAYDIQGLHSVWIGTP